MTQYKGFTVRQINGLWWLVYDAAGNIVTETGSPWFSTAQRAKAFIDSIV